jgi:hypothetical protein
MFKLLRWLQWKVDGSFNILSYYLLENYAGSPPMRAGFVPRAVHVEFGGQSGTRTGFSPKFSPLSNIPQLLHIHLYIICTLDNGPINNQS